MMDSIYKDFKPQFTDVWLFRHCETGYGRKDYPGKCNSQIIKNLLWFYTQKGDLVVDPFGGGGTTYDVCKEWKRRCYISDINPCRPEIIKRDVTTDGLPDVDAQLIFLDPPYVGMKQGKYTNEPTDFSNMSLARFFDRLGKLTKECKKILNPRGRIAIIMSTSIRKGYSHTYVNLTHNLHDLFHKAGFKLAEFITCPYFNLDCQGYHVTWARQNGKLLRRARDIQVFVHKSFDFRQKDNFDHFKLTKKMKLNSFEDFFKEEIP